MLLSIGILIVVFILAYFAFVNYYPSFGGDVSEDRQKVYASSRQFRDGLFKNTKDVPKETSFWEMLSIARKFFFEKVENGRPEKEPPMHRVDSVEVVTHESGTRLVWFGHSAFLLQMEGKTVLLDPMLGPVPAPHPMMGSKRFNPELPISIEKLPHIDAVLISHDHYDHLDYESIKKLKDKVDQFYVPLGVGVHLEAWGVSKDSIHEMDWWQDTKFGNLEFVCTPAQHFSGRKMNNGQSTLWASWVIKSQEERIFFSGDSGYSNHFKEIGEAHGPFDFAMLECGQYNKLWPDIHMFPEETAQAGMDLRAKTIMPIHWGGFKLALHSWTDPIERVSKKANSLGIPLIAPEIGSIISLDSIQNQELRPWW